MFGNLSHDLHIHLWFLIAIFISLYNALFVQRNEVNAFSIALLYIISATLPLDYNSDIQNYYSVYRGMATYNPLAWNYEPGFNSLLFLFYNISNSDEFGFFLLRLFPGIILAYAILSNKFQTSFAPFYICCLGLVLSATTLRASYGFSFLCLALSIDYGKYRNSALFVYLTSILMHLSTLPVIVILLIKRLDTKAVLFLSVLACIFLAYSNIIQQMIAIIIDKVLDRGATLRSTIPYRAIQFIVVAAILLILFRNNGRYIKENIGLAGMIVIAGLTLVSIVNYGLSRTLLYCYPLVFLKNKEGKNLRSLNQLICLMSLPGALLLYLEFR